MSGEKARIAVIGTGWWAGEHHIPSLQGYERAEVVAFCDKNAYRLAQAARMFGVERTYTETEELFAAGDVDGVLIALPHAYHYPVARDALDAGLHVFVEKPMVLRAAEARDLIARAADRRRRLMVGFTYHFSPYARRARELVQSGRIGEVRLVSGLFASMADAYYRGEPDEYSAVFEFRLGGPNPETYSDPAISGGGQAVTQITHAIAMVLWVTQRRVIEVTAMMDNLGQKVDLVDAAAYRMDNGALGTMGSTGTLAPKQRQQQEFRYYGTEGYLLQDIWAGRLSAVHNDGTTMELPDLTGDDIYPAGAPSRAFVDLILDGGENLAPAETGLAAVEFVEAAYRSAAEGGRPVRVEELY